MIVCARGFAEVLTPTVSVTVIVSASSGTVSVTVMVSLSMTVAGSDPLAPIVSVSLTVPMHPFESVAVMINGKLPVWVVASPLSTPPTKMKPEGSVKVVMPNVIGLTPPVAVKVTGPYGMPSAAGGSEVGLTVIVVGHPISSK